MIRRSPTGVAWALGTILMRSLQEEKFEHRHREGRVIIEEETEVVQLKASESGELCSTRS